MWAVTYTIKSKHLGLLYATLITEFRFGKMRTILDRGGGGEWIEGHRVVHVSMAELVNYVYFTTI